MVEEAFLFWINLWNSIGRPSPEDAANGAEANYKRGETQQEKVFNQKHYLSSAWEEG